MEKRAIPFRETRKIHKAVESAEDYTELIQDLIAENGKARICDLAKKMGISHVTVVNTVKRLIRDGYVVKNEDITLTEKGEKTARFSREKHQVLASFLRKLGVSESVIATDVEGIEHHISLETLRAIEKFIAVF